LVINGYFLQWYQKWYQILEKIIYYHKLFYIIPQNLAEATVYPFVSGFIDISLCARGRPPNKTIAISHISVTIDTVFYELQKAHRLCYEFRRALWSIYLCCVTLMLNQFALPL